MLSSDEGWGLVTKIACDHITEGSHNAHAQNGRRGSHDGCILRVTLW